MLLAYAKLALNDALLASRVPDEPYLARELERYFPAQMRERFPDAIESHRLRREIIATQLANAIVNRGGPTIVTRLVDQTGADAPTIAAAYAAVRDSFGLVDLNAAIDALDGRCAGKPQLAPLRRAAGPAARAASPGSSATSISQAAPLDGIVAIYGGGIAEIAAPLPQHPAARRRRRRWRRASSVSACAGVPDELARRVAALPTLSTAPDIVLVAQTTGTPVADVAALHFAVGGVFRLGALARRRPRHRGGRLLRPPRPRPRHRRHRGRAPPPDRRDRRVGRGRRRTPSAAWSSGAAPRSPASATPSTASPPPG